MTSGGCVGAVRSLSRFPVKSTSGEALSVTVVDHRGLVRDREWAAYTADGGIASGKTTRRFRQVAGLMDWRSTADSCGGTPALHSPDGDNYRVDDPNASRALTRALGRSLTLRGETAIRHHDECAVHVVTTSSIRRVEQAVGGAVDVRRLRANIVLDTQGTGFLEDSWCGADLAVGPEVVLRLTSGMPRCVMLDQPQVDVSAEPSVLRELGRIHGVMLGVRADVIRTGTISLGDEARLMPR